MFKFFKTFFEMLESIKQLVGWLKTQPTTIRLIVVVLLAALLVALSFTSCARSSMRFKGTGEVEYFYKGSLGPDLSSDKNN